MFYHCQRERTDQDGKEDVDDCSSISVALGDEHSTCKGVLVSNAAGLVGWLSFRRTEGESESIL